MMIYLLTALISLKCYYSYSIYNSQIISTRLYCNPNNPKPEFLNKQYDLPDYTIPSWVYKKVFKYNKPTKKIKDNDRQFYLAMKPNPKHYNQHKH